MSRETQTEEKIFAVKTPLVGYVPAKLESGNLDRVITHLLGQVVMQGDQLARMEEANAVRDVETEALRSQGEAARAEIERAAEETRTLTLAVRSAEKRAAGAETNVTHLREALKQLKDEVTVVSLGSTQLAEKARLADSRISRTEDSTAAIQKKMFENDSIMSVSAIREELAHLNTDITHTRENNNSVIDALQKSVAISIATAAEENAARVAVLEATLPKHEAHLKHLESKFGDIDFSAFEMKINAIQRSLRDVHQVLDASQTEVHEQLKKVSERCDDVTLQCHSVVEQLAVKGGFVNETSDTATSVLALLGNKISDILSVLILFENKVHKNEEALDRLEGHLASALKNNWSSGRSEPTKPRKPVRETPAPAPPPVVREMEQSSDGALLATKALFKCLSCNTNLKTHLQDTRYRLGMEGQIPGAVSRSPKMQFGRAPLAPQLPPTTQADSPVKMTESHPIPAPPQESQRRAV